MAARAAWSFFSGVSRAGGACLAETTRSAARGESLRSLLGSDLSVSSSANTEAIRRIVAQLNAKIGFSSPSSSPSTKACAGAGAAMGASACSRLASSTGVSGRTALVAGVKPSLAAVLAGNATPRLFHGVQIGKASREACAGAGAAMGASACLAASTGVSGRTALVAGVKPSLAAVLAGNATPRLSTACRLARLQGPSG